MLCCSEVEDEGPFCILEPCGGLQLSAAGVTVTEKRPTFEPAVGSDVALLLLDTWKRPMVVGGPAGPTGRDDAPFTPSFSQTPLAREDDRWRVFSGLEGEEEEEEDEEEEVEDGVREEEETMPEGSGAVLGAPSVATDTWKRPTAFGGWALLPP